MKTPVPPVAILIGVASIAACDLSNVPQGAPSSLRAHHSETPQLSSSVASASTAPPGNDSCAPSIVPSTDRCDMPRVRQAMAQELFADQDFHDYICEEQPCTAQGFLEGLTFDEVVLRDKPRTLGCIVGPLHPALTGIYGVFVLEEKAPSLALVYLGRAIDVDPAFKKPSFKDLLGTDQVDAFTWATHRYVWSYRGYALERTTLDTEGAPP